MNGTEYGTNANVTSGAANSMSTRINAVTVAVGATSEWFLGNGSQTSFSVDAPELQAASPFVPLGIASPDTGRRGKIADRIDVWFACTRNAVQGDSFGTKQFYFLGSAVYPGDGTTVLVFA